MKLKGLLLSALFILVMTFPSYAGWEQYQSGEWVYTRNGQNVTSEWISSGSDWYYIGPDGIMLKSNYTPDGYWVNAYGIYEPWWGKRTDRAYFHNNVKYFGETETSYIYTFTQDTYADGNIHWTMTETLSWLPNYKITLELYELSPFSYAAMDLMSGDIMGYVTVSPDSNVVYVSMGGITERCETRIY